MINEDDKFNIINGVLEGIDCYLDSNNIVYGRKENKYKKIEVRNLYDGSLYGTSRKYINDKNVWSLKPDDDMFFIISDINNIISIYAFVDDNGLKLIEGYEYDSKKDYTNIKCFTNDALGRRKENANLLIRNDSIKIKYNMGNETLDIMLFDKEDKNINEKNDFIFEDINHNKHLLGFTCDFKLEDNSYKMYMNKSSIFHQDNNSKKYGVNFINNNSINDFYNNLGYLLVNNNDIRELLTELDEIIPLDWNMTASKYVENKNFRNIMLLIDKIDEKVLQKH